MIISTQKIQKALQVFLLQAKSLLLNQRFYLLGLVTTLAVLHTSLVVNHSEAAQEVSFYALGWAGIILLLWQNGSDDVCPDWFSSCLGLLLLFFVILRPLNLWNLDLTLFIFSSIVAALGLGLLAKGLIGLRHQWRLFLIFCLMCPYGFLNKVLSNRLHFFSHLTTVISAFLLHYMGWKANYDDVLLTLPTGQVSVEYACTGGPLIVWLLKPSLLIVILFALTGLQKLGLALSTSGTGVFIGCIRVALLAIVVNNHSRFQYWHGPAGAQIFLAAAILAYVVLCNWLLPLEELSSTKHYKRSDSPNSPATTMVQKWRLPLLTTTWMAVVFAAIYHIGVGTTGRRLLSTYTLTNTLSLNGWQQVSATSLKSQTSDALTTSDSGLVQSGKQYRYLKNNRQLEIQMRYVVNTRGEPNPFEGQPTGILVKEYQKNTIQLNRTGYYELKTDVKLAYLTACINPRGGSTVTSAQFLHNRYTNDFTWSRILNWVSGKEVLKDNRCIWAQLSTPLNGVTASETYQILESVWANNYTRWQSRFPPP